MELVERIGRAIERITTGQAAMRVPVDSTDPDVVLVDCEKEITRLRATVEELRRQRGDILTEAEKRMASELAYPVSLSHALNILRDLRAALNDARKGEGDE